MLNSHENISVGKDKLNLKLSFKNTKLNSVVYNLLNNLTTKNLTIINYYPVKFSYYL